jgi:transposase
MDANSRDRLTLSQRFLEPSNSTHRQYEALRAFFVDGLPSAEAAARFGYTPGSFRLLVHQFRKQPGRNFFAQATVKGRPPGKQNRLREQLITLRKQNLSVHDISRALANEGQSLSPAAVAAILKKEGFAKLPRRLDEERPERPHPVVAAMADVRQLDLTPRTFHTDFGGLFLFLPDLVAANLHTLLARSGFPGSKRIPAACAVRSLLALKLFGNARHCHVMSAVLDDGLALFAGLNVIPKRSFLTEYSCRIHPSCYPKLMRGWFDAVSRLGLRRGASFDLDFHTIPFHGEDALVEKHYISKRSRRQKGMVAFLAQDADTRVFCYANAELRKNERDGEILRFVAFWKQRTGFYPEEVIFDSKLTTYAKLSELNRLGIRFITVRRRSKALLDEIAGTPISAWQRVTLESVARAYKTPRVLDREIRLKGYEGPLRQLTVTDLGHEQPTLLLTNQLKRSACHLIDRYAQRMLIENNIEDGIDFFHMDALSSAVAMKVNCDLQLTLMASSLYRLLAVRIGNGYEIAKSRHLFRDLINASATLTIAKETITVRFQRRAHNPLLVAAGFHETKVAIPWLSGRQLRLMFG